MCQSEIEFDKDVRQYCDKDFITYGKWQLLQQKLVDSLPKPVNEFVPDSLNIFQCQNCSNREDIIEFPCFGCSYFVLEHSINDSTGNCMQSIVNQTGESIDDTFRNTPQKFRESVSKINSKSLYYKRKSMSDKNIANKKATYEESNARRGSQISSYMEFIFKRYKEDISDIETLSRLNRDTLERITLIFVDKLNACDAEIIRLQGQKVSKHEILREHKSLISEDIESCILSLDLDEASILRCKDKIQMLGCDLIDISKCEEEIIMQNSIIMNNIRFQTELRAIEQVGSIYLVPAIKNIIAIFVGLSIANQYIIYFSK